MTLLGLWLPLTACNDSVDPGTDMSGLLAIPYRGNGQISFPYTELPAPLAVRVLNRRGMPVAGIGVDWSVSDDGSVTPQRTETDRSGIARATWRLGPREGRQHALAAVLDQQLHFSARATEQIPLGRIQWLSLSPTNGEAEFVHPDVARVPDGWASARRFLAITTYPGGDFHEERPWMFASGVRSTWQAPEGLANPLVRVRRGYLSDPDLVFVPERGELWLYYRFVSNRNRILLKTSSDGTNWSRTLPVVSAPNHMLVSPSIVRVTEHDWHMWSVNAGTVGCAALATLVEHRTSSDGIHWSPPERVQMGNADLPPWHIDVNWIPEHRQFWALYNGKPAGSCATPALYLTISSDGITWETHPTPVLERGVFPLFQDVVYRSSFEYDATSDVVTLFYSGARYTEPIWIWSAAVQRLSRPALFARTRVPIGLRRNIAPSKAPPLLDVP